MKWNTGMKWLRKGSFPIPSFDMHGLEMQGVRVSDTNERNILSSLISAMAKLRLQGHEIFLLKNRVEVKGPRTSMHAVAHEFCAAHPGGPMHEKLTNQILQILQIQLMNQIIKQ